jgi:hypothetical protein
MRANQLRLWFASMAYVLLCALRRIAHLSITIYAAIWRTGGSCIWAAIRPSPALDQFNAQQDHPHSFA